MITADQLVAHAIGDYVLQSDWMAGEKTKKTVAALAHVITYAWPFVFLRPSLPALAIIVVTHFIIDRWRLARYVVWAKNYLAPLVVVLVNNVEGVEGHVLKSPNPPWSEVKDSFGYPKDRPPWLAMWLMIIADNTLHVICNGAAFHYFP